MDKQLQLIKSEPFGNVQCDFYSDGSDYLMTREQIGLALEYINPMVAIGKIHDRHGDRLNKYSFTKLVNGRNTYLYNRKGIMEICRWSQQPKADTFMDFTWEVMDALMSGKAKVVPKDSYMIEDPIERAKAWIVEAEERKSLVAKVEQDKPKVLFADAVETSKTSILIGDFAKILRQNGVNIGQNRLFQWLRNNDYLIKFGERYNMPTQKSMDLKLFEIKERTINNPDGSIRVTKTVKMTGKGQQYFCNRFIGQGAA